MLTVITAVVLLVWYLDTSSSGWELYQYSHVYRNLHQCRQRLPVNTIGYHCYLHRVVESTLAISLVG